VITQEEFEALVAEKMKDNPGWVYSWFKSGPELDLRVLRDNEAAFALAPYGWVVIRRMVY